MASNINPFNIDGNYPIAGQDNDSQGFRDNFTNVRNNLGFAKAELEDLQSKALLKAPLVGGTVANNMNGAIIDGAQFRNCTTTDFDVPVSVGTATVNFANGGWQSITVAEPVAIAFSNIPAAERGNATVRLSVNVSTLPASLTFPAAVAGVANLQGSTGQVLSFSATGLYILELNTNDGGTTLLISDVNGKLRRIPAVTFVPTTTLASAYSVQLGRYVRNGDVVNFNISLAFTSNETSGGAVTVTLVGLPNALTLTGFKTPVTIGDVSGFTLAAGTYLTGVISPNTNVITLQKTSATGATTAAITDTDVAAGAATISISGSYIANA